MAVFTFVGCKKDDGGSGSGGSTLNTYFPLTSNTNWTYKVTTNGTVTNPKFTVQATTKTFGSKAYTILKSDANDSSYYNQTGNDYFRYFKFNNLLGEIELNVLKDNLAVSGTWVNSKTMSGVTIPGVPLPVSVTVNFNFSIAAKPTSRTVLTKTYNDIIQSHVEIVAVILGTNTNVGSGDFYFSKNIGLIEYSLNTNTTAVGGASNTEKYELSAYEIK